MSIHGKQCHCVRLLFAGRWLRFSTYRATCTTHSTHTPGTAAQLGLRADDLVNSHHRKLKSSLSPSPCQVTYMLLSVLDLRPVFIPLMYPKHFGLTFFSNEKIILNALELWKVSWKNSEGRVLFIWLFTEYCFHCKHDLIFSEAEWICHDIERTPDSWEF